MIREPLAVRGAIVAVAAAVINLACAFGLKLSGDQLAAVNALIGVAATAVVVLWSRGAVTPVQDPHDDNGQPLVPLAEDY